MWPGGISGWSDSLMRLHIGATVTPLRSTLDSGMEALADQIPGVEIQPN